MVFSSCCISIACIDGCATEPYCREQYTTANELACDADSILHDSDSECGDEICGIDEEDSGAEDSVSYRHTFVMLMLYA